MPTRIKVLPSSWVGWVERPFARDPTPEKRCWVSQELDPTYLHSCSILSSACASPLSEYWSVDCVPLPEVPRTVRSPPLRMAPIMRASSATFLIQAPSLSVYIANLDVPISAVASVSPLNG